MHILVLGAGVVGITTAWYLRQAGHTVTVVDRQSQPAMETSFANGGQISVSHAGPWATPQAPGIGVLPGPHIRWREGDMRGLRDRDRLIPTATLVTQSRARRVVLLGLLQRREQRVPMRSGLIDGRWTHSEPNAPTRGGQHLMSPRVVERSVVRTKELIDTRRARNCASTVASGNAPSPSK